MQINQSPTQLYSRGVSFPHNRYPQGKVGGAAILPGEKRVVGKLEVEKLEVENNRTAASKRNAVERADQRALVNSTVSSENKQIVTTLNNYLPASSRAPVYQHDGSTARLVNPVKVNLAAFSRHAVQAYESTRRLEENNRLIQVLGFDAFA